MHRDIQRQIALIMKETSEPVRRPAAETGKRRNLRFTVLPIVGNKNTSRKQNE